MLRVILVLLLSAESLAGQPPDTAFHSVYKFRFRIPSSFKAAGSDRGYLETPAGKTPYIEGIWRGGRDSITIRAFLVPDASWQASPQQMFAAAKQNMLTDRSLKLVSERDYQVGNCLAHSFVFSRGGENPLFKRIDYILRRPEVNIIVYASRTKTSLDTPACKNSSEAFLSERSRRTNELGSI